jgi:hypothetical protein
VLVTVVVIAGDRAQQVISLIDERLRHFFINLLVLESESFEQREDLAGDRVPLIRDTGELVLKSSVGGIVSEAAAFQSLG